jgi:hypothetical protein
VLCGPYLLMLAFANKARLRRLTILRALMRDAKELASLAGVHGRVVQLGSRWVVTVTDEVEHSLSIDRMKAVRSHVQFYRHCSTAKATSHL